MSQESTVNRDITVSSYAHLFAPGEIGRLRLKNRVVMAPVDSVFRTEEGGVNEQHLDYLRARARGGVGMIICDNLAVEYPRGSVGVKPARIDQDRFIAALSDLVDEIHYWDVAIIGQIAHAGRQTTLGGSQGEPLVSSSAIGWEDSGTIPRELSTNEVIACMEQFVEGAARVQRAGFDAVEIHAAHGYLLSSFLSPALNQRNDAFGGSTRARSRIVVEIVSRVKERLGSDYPVLVRFNCRDGISGGLEPLEAVELGGIFEEAGVDALDLSAGTYEAPGLTFPPMMYGHGTHIDDMALVTRAVSVPVLVAGRIVMPDQADRIIADCKADFVALARALLSDPEWANKAQENREEDIRPCIGCNHGCIHRIDQDLAMRCNVNPDLGQKRFSTLRPAVTASREVMVVGAGPGGAEFALRAASQGHRVRLFEEAEEVGGQLRFARTPSFKRDLDSLVRFYSHRLEREGVDVLVGESATVELVAQVEPDILVVATGSAPVIPAALMAEGTPPITYLEVFGGSWELQGSALVIGAGQIGCDVAMFLAQRGVAITIVETLADVAPTEDASIRDFFRAGFAEHGVEVRTRTKVLSATSSSIEAVDMVSGSVAQLPYENLVLAVGVRPNRDLFNEVKANQPTHLVGDCHSVGTILEATARAARLAEELM